MYTIFAVLVITSSLVATENASAPAPEPELIIEDILPDLDLCSITHWYIERCLKKSIETMKIYLRKGVPELNIPYLEPYRIENLKMFTMTNYNTFKGDVMFNNTKISGLTNFLIDNIRVSIDLDRFQLDVQFPLITVNGKNILKSVSNNILEKQYYIEGYFEDVRAKIDIFGYFFWKKETHFKVDDVDVKLSIEDSNMNIKNNTKKEVLEDQEISYVKEIWDTLKLRARENAERIASKLILQIANKIYLTFSLETLMPVYV